jgi:hypothetical protein
MSYLSDLEGGSFPSSFRWNAESGEAVMMGLNEVGDREPRLIEPGSSASKFVMDMATAERGYDVVGAGFCDMRLTAVGSPPPPRPLDKDGKPDKSYKPALGCWLWNPIFGEVRCETNAFYFRTALDGTWVRYRTFKPNLNSEQGWRSGK